MSKKIGGPAPYGFTWTNGELAPVPHETPIYALAFDLFLLHQRVATTASELNKRGYRNSGGDLFKTKSVKRMLNNTIAKGVHCVPQNTAKGENNIISLPVESVVTEKTWNHVQDILEEQSGNKTRQATQDYFIGKIFCHCSTPMDLPSKAIEYNCFDCKARVSKDDLLNAFESQITQLALPSDNTLNELSKTSIKDIQTDPQRMLKEVERDIDKLYKLHASDSINDKAFKQRFDILEKRKKQLLTTINNLKTPNPSSSLVEQWHALSKQYKRILVENLVDQIVVSKESISFTLFPLFNFTQQVDKTLP